jgi:8-oxo-dGTP diphosphatase
MNEKLLKQFNEEKATPEQISKLRLRNAVRVVIIDKESNIALINVKKGGYYSLPGGGVEKEESIEETVIRESKEETGCRIEIIDKVGVTEEIRLKDNLLIKTHCFLASLLGKKGAPQFSLEEINDQFEVSLVSADEALTLLKSYDKSTKLYFKYYHEREIIFLESAIPLIKKLQTTCLPKA